MVTDLQIRRLRRLDHQGLTKGQAAARAGLDDKTARKYRRLGRLPGEVRMEHTWRTRPNPFAEVWPRVEELCGSTIHVGGNTYSVASRLIGEWVEARLHADHVEAWYAQRLVEHLPRLRGRGKHRIAYRHVIDWLVRKPGAFAGYRYRDELFPSSRFRLAYDRLVEQQPGRAAREYLGTLYLAARESEAGAEAVLEQLVRSGGPWTVASVEQGLRRSSDGALSVTEVVVAPADLAQYDALLEGKETNDGGRA
jgi:hypothetical protein